MSDPRSTFIGALAFPPRNVGPKIIAISVASGNNHMLVVAADSNGWNVWGVGKNDWGQLGLGHNRGGVWGACRNYCNRAYR